MTFVFWQVVFLVRECLSWHMHAYKRVLFLDQSLTPSFQCMLISHFKKVPSAVHKTKVKAHASILLHIVHYTLFFIIIASYNTVE